MSILSTGGPTFLNNLLDVEAPTPNDGDGITWVSANNRWESNPLGAGGAISLNTLTDVTTTTPSTGHLLRFNGTIWVNVTPATVAGDIAFNDLSDTTLGSPTANDVPSWNGSAWVNVTPQSIVDLATINLNDLGDVNSGTPGAGQDGHVLQWDDGAGEFNLTPAGGSGVAELNDLTDVTVATPLAGQFLQYNAGTGDWENVTVAPGSGVGGAGVAGRVAFWTTTTDIGHDDQFLWDASLNRLSVGAFPATAGSLALDNGDSIMWRNGANSDNYGLVLNSSNFFTFVQPGTDFEVDFNSSVTTSTAGGIRYNFWNLGSGTSAIRSEGFIEAHEASGFSSGMAATGAFRMPFNSKVGWRNAINSADLTIGLDSGGRWQFSETSTNIVEFSQPVATATLGGVAWRFGNPGSGTSKFQVDGWLEIYRSSGFASSPATSGDIRLINGGFISARNFVNSTNIDLIQLTSSDRVRLAGAADWPTVNAPGVLSNPGSGDLSWTSFTLNALTDVNITSPSNGSLLHYNSTSTQWEDVTVATILGATSVNIHSDVTGSPTLNNILLGNGTTWVSTTKVGLLALNDLSDTTVPSPTTNDVLQWSGSAWVDSSPATIVGQTSVGAHSDVTTAGEATGHLFRWSGTAWVNVPPSTVAADIDLGDLGDVNTSGAATGEVLKWSGSAWVPTTNAATRTVVGYATWSSGTSWTEVGSGFTVTGTIDSPTITLTNAFGATAVCVCHRKVTGGGGHPEGAQSAVASGTGTFALSFSAVSFGSGPIAFTIGGALT